MSPTDKPFSAASERNREPILAVLRNVLPERRHVLEIGSGTGQHAVHFAAAMPWLTWQASDRPDNLAGIRQWLDEAALTNTPAPLPLDVNDSNWPPGPFDAVYSANTLHIMNWPEVGTLFARLASIVSEDALLAIYGPFNKQGCFTSPSNARFDAQLKAQTPHMGIRDAEAVDKLAADAGFALKNDIEMPANNRLRVWQRCG